MAVVRVADALCGVADADADPPPDLCVKKKKKKAFAIAVFQTRCCNATKPKGSVYVTRAARRRTQRPICAQQPKSATHKTLTSKQIVCGMT